MKLREIFPYIFIAILMYFLIVEPKQEKQIIEVPAKSGQFVEENPQPVIKWDTIYQDSIIEKVVQIENPQNKELLKKYEEAQDSITKLNLYKSAITERDYKQVFRDANQEITVYSKVIGSLERQEIDYSIDRQEIEMDNPTEGLYMGLGSSFSYKYLELPTVDVSLSYIKNKRIYSLGVGTDQTVKIRYKQKIF